MRECRQRMKDDYLEEVQFGMGLNSDRRFVGKDRPLAVLRNELLNIFLSGAVDPSLSWQL